MAAPSFLSPPSNPVVALPSSPSPPIRGGARTSRDCWNLLLAFVICIVLQGGCDMHMHIATVAEVASETDPCHACVWNERIRLRSPTRPAAHGDGDFEVLTCSRGNMNRPGPEILGGQGKISKKGHFYLPPLRLRKNILYTYMTIVAIPHYLCIIFY